MCQASLLSTLTHEQPAKDHQLSDAKYHHYRWTKKEQNNQKEKRKQRLYRKVGETIFVSSAKADITSIKQDMKRTIKRFFEIKNILAEMINSVEEMAK
jgi:hypothetical protein